MGERDRLGHALLAIAFHIPTLASAQGPPLPPQRPPGLGDGPSGPLLPPERQDGVGASDLPEDEAACRQRLSAQGVLFEPLRPIQDEACRAPHPLRILQLSGGVAVGSPGAMTCALAEALATWSRESIAPAGRELLGRTLSGIAIGTTYECRGQNRNAAARLSEHAFANGADIAGFSFTDGQRLSIGAVSTIEGRAAFLSTVRASACKVFTTVLGPGADGHADHIHVDMRMRSRGHRVCQ